MTPEIAPPRIYLIGPRGSGKTTLAALLAHSLGWDWTDADRVLEEREGRSVRAIFETEGEPAFRARERATLAELATRDRHVIATGGGVVLHPDNRALLRASGLVVRLTADVATLCARLANDAATSEQRPSLTGRSAVDPEEVAAVIAARDPLYAATAHVTVDTTNLPSDALVAAILGHLRSRD